MTQRQLSGGQQRDAPLQGGYPVLLRAVIGIGIGTQGVQAPVEAGHVGCSIEIQVAVALEEAERLQANSAF